MEQKDIYLSVIIPAYNEDNRIEETILRMNQFLSTKPYPWEILVVSDGSTDLTIQKVSQLAARVRNLRWIDRKKNKGKGYSVKEGMLASHGKIRLFADADNSTDISHFDKMRPYFDKGYDVVICSRDKKDAEGAQQAEPQKWFKRMLGNVGNLYIQLMAVRGTWDTQCGFKAFRAGAAKKIFKITKVNRWAFDIEVLAIARAINLRLKIVPAYWINDPRSHVKLSSYLQVLWETTKIGFRIRRGAYKLDEENI